MLNLQNPNTSLVILLFTFFVSWILTMVGAFPLLFVTFFVLLYTSVIIIEKYKFLVYAIIFMNIVGILSGVSILYVSTERLWSGL